MGQQLECTVVLDKLLASKASTKSLRGGTRSTKTWSIIQNICLLCQDSTPYEFTIARSELTWLKQTVLKDFEKIIDMLGWRTYPAINPRRSEQEYNLLNNQISFMGAHDEGKLFGRSQHFFWINEAPELTRRHFDQMDQRTSIGSWLDYNPIGTDLWMYELEETDDCDLITSTVLDNPFAPERIVKKIQGYEPTPANIAAGTADAYMWDVYGLGKPAKLVGLIYQDVTISETMPEDLKKRGYGLDFGFSNDPTALHDCALNSGKVFVDEVIYETGLTNPEIFRLAKDRGVDFNRPCYADDASPKDIQELYDLGWRGIVEAKKGKIDHGIQLLKQYPINITTRSAGIRKESNRYKWATDRAGVSLNKPVDKFNHGWDAVRYWAVNELGEGSIIKPAKITFRRRR